MKNISGPPVEGDDFFGREKDVAELWETLQSQDVLLLGPRRIGKTSLARRVMSVAREHRWHAVEINVASCLNEQMFVDKLAREIEHLAKSWSAKTSKRIGIGISRILERVRSVEVPTGGGSAAVEIAECATQEWSVAALDTLNLIASLDSHWLIYIDELPIFLFKTIEHDPIHGVARVRRFLDWFRNDVRGPRNTHLHWLVSGSIGLDTLVQRHRMADTINSFRQVGLDPFIEEEAIALVQRLANSYALVMTRADCERMVSAIGWPQPYYLQLAFNSLRDHLARAGVTMSDAIDGAIAQLVEPGVDNDFHHWEQRLEVQLEAADAAVAIALLGIACAHVTGARADALLAEVARRFPRDADSDHRKMFVRVRDVLIRDAYWSAVDVGGVRSYRFCLEPLRRWWSRRLSI